MPLLTDDARIAELRKQFPTLTHTSWRELPRIEPRPNVDKHHQDMGNIVCATNTDSDFYALRCNEKRGMINFSFSYRDFDGKSKKIFIFEKMKDSYYEHAVSSEFFTPIVSEQGVFSGEWVSHNAVQPVSVKVGKKEDILKRTEAMVFTIADMKRFKEKLHDDAFIQVFRNQDTALPAVQKLVEEGILKGENNSLGIRQKLSKSVGVENAVAQNGVQKNRLSPVKQASISVKQVQH